MPESNPWMLPSPSMCDISPVVSSPTVAGQICCVSVLPVNHKLLLPDHEDQGGNLLAEMPPNCGLLPNCAFHWHRHWYSTAAGYAACFPWNCTVVCSGTATGPRIVIRECLVLWYTWEEFSKFPSSLCQCHCYHSLGNPGASSFRTWLARMQISRLWLIGRFCSVPFSFSCDFYHKYITLLELFQKLSSGRGGPHFFPDPSTPRTHMESEPPPTLRTPLAHYGSNMPWPPGQVDPLPPLRHINNAPTGPKSACAPPRIISGTALMCFCLGLDLT